MKAIYTIAPNVKQNYLTENNKRCGIYEKSHKN